MQKDLAKIRALWKISHGQTFERENLHKRPKVEFKFQKSFPAGVSAAAVAAAAAAAATFYSCQSCCLLDAPAPNYLFFVRRCLDGKETFHSNERLRVDTVLQKLWSLFLNYHSTLLVYIRLISSVKHSSSIICWDLWRLCRVKKNTSSRY